MNGFKWITLLVVLSLTGCIGNDDTKLEMANRSGSLASMTIVGDILYILNNDEIVSVDISPHGELSNRATTQTHIEDAETLISYSDKYLLAGTQQGVEVFEIPTLNEPSDSELSHIGRFDHARAYDPIIAVNELGFVTTRDGNEEQSSSSDALTVLNLSDLSSPTVITELHVFDEPAGLAISGEKLFVCDLNLGLIEFDLFGLNSLEEFDVSYVTNYSEFQCNDIIAKGEHLILISERSITQLSLEEQSINVLSQIPTY